MDLLQFLASYWHCSLYMATAVTHNPSTKHLPELACTNFRARHSHGGQPKRAPFMVSCLEGCGVSLDRDVFFVVDKALCLDQGYLDVDATHHSHFTVHSS